jgi:hypothetical protein
MGNTNALKFSLEIIGGGRYGQALPTQRKQARRCPDKGRLQRVESIDC